MIVTVHALFSHNNMIGSKIIAHGSAHLEPNMPKTSHVAVLINERWVHESTGNNGVAVISYDKWKSIHKEVARVQLKSREYQEIADRYREIQKKDYDYLGVLYLGLCIIPTFLGFKLLKRNMWQSKTRYFCCEVLGYLTGQDYSMCSPVQILGMLSRG